MAQLPLSELLLSVPKLNDKDALLAILRMTSPPWRDVLLDTAIRSPRTGFSKSHLKSTVTPFCLCATSSAED